MLYSKAISRAIRSSIQPRSSQCKITSPSRSFTSSQPHQNKSSADPQAIADAFLSKFASGQTFHRRQLLDANQLRLFSLTLDRPNLWSSSTTTQQTSSPSETEPKQGTPLPPGYHLAYFTPAQLPGILGIDGTDASFNPERPFTRRMWAGGSVSWPNSAPSSTSSSGSNSQQNYLKVGETATEITKVLSCLSKTIKKTGESMLVVSVEKSFLNGSDELCVVDQRNWVFRVELDPSKPSSPPKSKPKTISDVNNSNGIGGKENVYSKHFLRDPATLFRFSALTFNAHKIHYDRDWARDVEGHRDIVVHGPLNLISMLDLWRDWKSSTSTTSVDHLYPKSIEYRATSPVYAGEGYRIVIDEAIKNEKGGVEVNVVSDDGTACMKGVIGEW